MSCIQRYFKHHKKYIFFVSKQVNYTRGDAILNSTYYFTFFGLTIPSYSDVIWQNNLCETVFSVGNTFLSFFPLVYLGLHLKGTSIDTFAFGQTCKLNG